MNIRGNFAIFSFGVLFLLAIGASAQDYVTPIVKPTPAGQLIIVNNGPGDQTDPHVSGNLAIYTNAINGISTIHYFDLVTGIDATVPNPGDGTVYDFLADIRGTTIVFTRVTTSGASIYSFDTATPGTPPAPVAPTAPSPRSQPTIGDQTIVWQQGNYPADIVAYDRTSGATTTLTNSSAGVFDNQSPAVSPDGTVIVWQSCNGFCTIWRTTPSNGTWNPQRIVSQVGGTQSHPDSDGTTIVYSAQYQLNGVTAGRVIWQPVGGGTEQVLNFQGEGISPGVSGGLIAFDAAPAAGSAHGIAVYDVANNVIYNVTADIGAQPGADQALLDISVTPDGQVRVVWEVREADWNIYAYTFKIGADLAITKTAPPTAVAGSNITYNLTVTNNGPQTANSVVVTDTLPPETSLVSCTTANGICGGTNTGPTITFDSLANGASETMTIVATTLPTQQNGTVVSNTATVSALGIDPNPSNNSSTALTQIINVVPLTITANNAARPFGGAEPVFTVSYSGFVNGDGPGSLSGTLVCASSDAASSPVGTYAINCSGLSSPNYTITFVRGTLSVVQENTLLTVTFAPPSIPVGLSTTATVTLTAPDMVIPIPNDPTVLAPVTLTSPVLSDILSNNGVCTPVPSTSPGIASCTINVTSVEPNGRTFNASFAGSTNLAASTATVELMVTAALQSQQTCIQSDFRNVSVSGGNYLWFNSIFKVRDVTKQLINLSFYNSKVQFQYTDAGGNLVTVNQTMPDAHIVIDPNATSASTTFDAVNKVWLTTIPFDLDDNSFLTGLPWLVPAGGIPADVEPVTWCGTFASDVAGVDVGWRWAAAAYSSFNSDNNMLGVKPMDTDNDNPPKNHDRAGTPEVYKQFVIPGARGKSGTNYTGTYSRSKEIE